MIPYILAAGPEAVAAGFGAAVAMVLLGTFVLRWYRMRQEYALLRIAMEKGIAPQMNPALPQWLISLRQGVLIATLGLAIAGIGAISWNMASGIEKPEPQGISAATLPAEINEPAPPPPPPQAEPGRRGGRGPEPRDNPRPPRPRDVAMERWDRAQAQINISMSMVGGGLILVLLGVVRIAFVPAEKRFSVPISR